MIEAAEASGELEPGRELLEPTSGNTGISLALIAKLKGYPLTCVMPENATEERRRLLRLYGATIVDSPGDQGSNGAVRLALELAEREPRYFMPFQYANPANPRAHYEGTGAEIAEALDRVDVLVAGLGTGGTLMGTGERLRESVPRRRRRRGRAAARRPGDGAALARGRLRAADPRRLEARPEGARLERGVGRAPSARCSTREGIFAGVSAGAVVHVARKLAAELDEGVVVCVLADAGWKYLCADFWERRRRRRRRWSARSGGSPARGARASSSRTRARRSRTRRAGCSSSRTASPSATCAGANAAASPYRFELEVDPELWFLEDDGYELAVFHSHLSSPPRPSRTDVENIGLWEGKPYLIYSLREDELAAWTIQDGEIARSRARRRQLVTLNVPFMPHRGMRVALVRVLAGLERDRPRLARR